MQCHPTNCSSIGPCAFTNTQECEKLRLDLQILRKLAASVGPIILVMQSTERTASILDPLEASLFPRNPSFERATSSNVVGPSSAASVCGAKIAKFAYPLAFYVPMTDPATKIPSHDERSNRDSSSTITSFEICVDETADAELQAAFQHWRRRLMRLVESVSFNMITIMVVVVDIASTIYFQIFIDDESKDCFGRDMPDEVSYKPYSAFIKPFCIIRNVPLIFHAHTS